jgi:hypothetical protein
MIGIGLMSYLHSAPTDSGHWETETAAKSKLIAHPGRFRASL